jgi:hypothetical protein
MLYPELEQIYKVILQPCGLNLPHFMVWHYRAIYGELLNKTAEHTKLVTIVRCYNSKCHKTGFACCTLICVNLLQLFSRIWLCKSLLHHPVRGLQKFTYVFNINSLKKDIKFQWVPSNCGVVVNKMADYWAKKGTRISLTSVCQLPFPSVKLRIRRDM